MRVGHRLGIARLHEEWHMRIMAKTPLIARASRRWQSYLALIFAICAAATA